MTDLDERKLYLGPRLRALRRELGVNQTHMAGELGISPSYLNHLERNQRPLTAQMLLRLARTYDIDVRDFVSGGGEGAASGLGEALADPLLRDIGVPRHEIGEVAENYPGITEAIGRLYRAVIDFRRMPDVLKEIGGQAPLAGSPLEWLGRYVAQRGNHLPDLDAAAEALAAGLPDDPARLQAGIMARLETQHRIGVRFVPEAMIEGALRHYDYHRRRLLLSERLGASGRLFALAYQLCTIELAAELKGRIDRAAAPDDETRRLLGVALTNHAAAALVMPYDRFRSAAEASRYDLPLLQGRFGVSFEQLAHRLTTLGRPTARGVPFFMLKIDIAGTVSKRFAGEAYPFARYGGCCPRWDVHASFRRPGELIAQVIETPDDKRFFTLVRASAPGGGRGGRSQTAIGIGCEMKHAPRLAAADACSAVPTSVGPACHLCERPRCPDRALPPVARSLEIGQIERSAYPYPFRQL